MPTPQRVLIVGTGSIGERHLRCFLATGRAAVSFVDTRIERRTEVAGRYPAATDFDDIEAALDAGVDAAVIATPANLHVPQAIRLVERDVHVLIEKPLAVGVDGVDHLCRLVAQTKVTGAVAYVYRVHPVLSAMRDAIASGAFGAPVELIAVSGQHFPFYRPAYHQTYYTNHATGGGAVQDALTHVVNAAEWLIGPVERVVADVAHQVLEAVDVEDTVHVLARHGSILASYSLNQYQAPNEMTITVVCERGTVRFEHHANRWRSMCRPDEAWADHSGPPLERDTLFTRQANAFLDAVEGAAQPVCTLEEGLQTLRVNGAILQSARTGAWAETGVVRAGRIR
jgi:predicted dehydrogenase